jgi:predicted metal-dependent peptidase
MTVSDFNLDTHIVSLLREEPFFAALSRKLEKVSTREIPTAGVKFNPDRCRFEMFYNPEFLGDLYDQNPQYVKGVLLHEFYHIVLLHVTSRLPDGGMTKKWNIATDLAINSELTNFEPDYSAPSGHVVQSSMLPIDKALIPSSGPFASMPPHLSAEEYMCLLPDTEAANDEGTEGFASPNPGGDSAENEQGTTGTANDPTGGDTSGNGFDDHSDWGDSDGTDEKRKIAEERLKENIKEAFIEAQSKGFGTVSQGMRRSIKDAITSKVNWRAVLRSFVKASQRADKSSTIKRLNRRYAYIHPGKKARRVAKIAVSVDQSGSVSDNMLTAFYTELDKLAQLAEFTIVPFDTQVSKQDIHVWKKGERRRKERYLSGGTCFNAPTRWVNENKFDGHIILTDMEAPKPVPSKCQRMWMTTKACAERPYFQTNERVIAIDD